MVQCEAFINLLGEKPAMALTGTKQFQSVRDGFEVRLQRQAHSLLGLSQPTTN